MNQSTRKGKTRMNFDYNKHLIYLHVAGSRSYGTDYEGSDWDYRGIIIPPRIYFLGCSSAFEQKQGLDGYGDDSTGFDIRKFMRLCADSSPNIIEALYVREEDQVIKTKYSDLLMANRHLFLSQKCHLFCGTILTRFVSRLETSYAFNRVLRWLEVLRWMFKDRSWKNIRPSFWTSWP